VTVLATSGSERRVWPRLRLNAEAILRFDNVASLRSRILNISGNGLLLAVPSPRPVGTMMGITVFFTKPSRELRIEGVVVHVATRNSLHEDDMPTCLGIYLTQVDAEWLKICDELAE
jgi:PilZ domain